MQDATFKICIFGDGGVGKTTLVNKYLTGIFKGTTKITIGLDFHIKVIDVDGLKVKLQIWDFAGEERFRFLLPSYVQGASGGVFMFDISRYASLKNIAEWIKVLGNGSAESNKKHFPILLVGGKSDLEVKRAVNRREAHRITKKYNLYEFFECSAKTGQNIDRVFTSIARKMLERGKSFEEIAKTYGNNI